MKLYIRNMVCIRCKMVVKSELENLSLYRSTVMPGEVRMREVISPEQREKLGAALKKSGFELVNETLSLLIEKISNIIVESVHYGEEQLRADLPEYMSRKLNHDYAYLANLFCDIKGTTIENYYAMHKIERVKELIVYYNLDLKEISYQLNYNSIAELKRQFLDVTGFSPAHFQKIRSIRNAVKEER